MKNYTFVKNVKSGITITLESSNMQLPARSFTMVGNVNQIAVPEEYALGLFVTDSALNMLKDGYFIVKDLNELRKKANEIGLFADVEIENCYSLDDINRFLKKADTKKIAEVIERHRVVEIENLVTLAREYIDELPAGIVTQIENACGAELRIE